MSEYISNNDKRLEFISGFTGSNGEGVITQKHAFLWTDGRYYLQAATELSRSWSLMKDGLTDTPKVNYHKF